MHSYKDPVQPKIIKDVKLKRENIKAPSSMVWKAVNRPTDIPVACGGAVSLSLQGLTPSQVRKEG